MRLKGVWLKRSLLTLGLAAALLLPALVVSGAPAHWSQRAVEQLRARGLMLGTAAPDAPITRAEAARLLVEAIGLAGNTQELWQQPSRFYDVAIGDSAANIELAAEVGFMRGYGGGVFGPGDPLTRAQLVAILVRALGWEDRAAAVATGDLPFTDSADVPAWARGYVAVAGSEKLVLGYGDGTFRPGAAVTQGDAAALIARFMAGRGALFQRAGVLGASPAGGRLSIGGETLALTPDAVIYRNGEAIPASSLRTGERVQAILDGAGRIRYAEVVIPAIAGALVSVSPGERQVQVQSPGGTAVTLSVRDDARIFRNGRAVTLADLRQQDQLYGLLDDAGKVKALDATRTDFDGVLVDAQRSAGARLVAVGQAGFVEAPISPTVVVYLNGQPARVADLRPSDHISFSRDNGGSVIYLEAKR
ncbi:MAG: S-layer homology domain-containing protein [Symbiobacteriia bacterium]